MFQRASLLVHQCPVFDTHVVHHNFVLLPSVEVEELDVACFATHLLLWHEVGRWYVRCVSSLIGIDTTSSISLRQPPHQTHVLCAQPVLVVAQGQSPCLLTVVCCKLHLVHCPLGSVVLSAELVVGFVRTVAD